MTETQPCPWCGNDPLYRQYHDEEWGVPLYNEAKLFEFLILEGAQAGLCTSVMVSEKSPTIHRL